MNEIALSLVTRDKLPRVHAQMFDAVAYSYMICPCRMTTDETRRRLKMVFEIWQTLRAQHRYTLDRLDHCLGRYLCYDLDGQKWEPLKRKTWLPGDPVSMSLPQLPNARPDTNVIQALRTAGLRVGRREA